MVTVKDKYWVLFLAFLPTVSFSTTANREMRFGAIWAPVTKSVPALQTDARRGDMEASFRVGMYYMFRTDCPAQQLSQRPKSISWDVPTDADSKDVGSASDALPADTQLSCEPQEAIEWLKPAALCGHLDAQYYLGYAYDELGLRGLAVGWYAVSAVRGHYLGQVSFGAERIAGYATPKDIVQAYQWAYLAYEGGYSRDNPVHAPWRKRMSPEQIVEAEKGIQVWKELHKAGNWSGPWPVCEPSHTGR
jgi:TPR repeat protein